MIEGVVNASYEAVIPLTLQGSAGQTRDIEAVIDTGFTDFLTLSPALVSELGLPFANVGWAVLADGSEVAFNVYRVTVLWDGQPRRAYAHVSDMAPLGGMALLHGCNLSADVVIGGRVRVQAIV